MRARQRTPVRIVWQYYRPLMQPPPLWVVSHTEMRDDGLYLVRRSGKQRMELGDWLVQNLDGEPEWMTDLQFRREYELLST